MDLEWQLVLKNLVEALDGRVDHLVVCLDHVTVIGRRSFVIVGATDVFDAQLVELSHPAGLWPLVSKHGPVVPHLHWFLLDGRHQIIAPKQPPHAASSALRPQDDLSIGKISKGVHLLLYNIGRHTQRPTEHFSLLKGIQKQRLVAKLWLKNLVRTSRNNVIIMRIGLKYVAHALYTLYPLYLLLHFNGLKPMVIKITNQNEQKWNDLK